MKKLLLLITSLALLAGPVMAADSPAPASAPPLDPVLEIVPILQTGYPNFADLHYKNGETLSDLISHSKGQIELDPISVTASPVFTAALPDGTVYCRLETFTPKKDWSTFVADFHQASKPGMGTVLDLRSNLTPNDYAGAAQLANIFAPAQTALLPYLSAREALQPAAFTYQGPLIVIVNSQTIGAAAVLASCLKTSGALVVGQSTSVTSAFFDEHKFSNGQVLRFATTPPTGLLATVSTLAPDITMSADAHNEKAALALIRDDHVLEVIEESAERRRMSEASLVHEQDPEWDDYLASLEKGPVILKLPRIHDPVLTTALDSLRAIRFSQEPASSQTAANASTPAPSLTLNG